jgi:MFS family permease
MSSRVSFVLVASVVVGFLAGSSAPTPLYPTYQAAWGFSPIATTVVFGIYAIAVLGALLVLGSLSDYVGRRPVLVAGIVLQIAAMLVFATANGLGMLIAARIIQGLGVGSAAAAAGATMLDLDRERGTVANAAVPGLGTATGALLSGLFVQFLPRPTVLIYLVLAAFFVVQAIAVHLMPETVTKKPGALASLRPHIRVHNDLRLVVLLAIPALVAAWALAGFYGSLGPALIRRVLGLNAPVLGGLALFALAGSGALTIVLAHRISVTSTVRLGAIALATGVGGVLLAIDARSMEAFFGATALAGVGFGASFHGGMRSVLSIAPAEHRAGVLSVLYLIAYLSMGIPAVLGGIRVVHGGGLVGTAYEYGAVVIVLAAVSFAGSLLRRRPAAQPLHAPT